VSVSTAAPTPPAGDDSGADFEVVIRSVGEDPAARSGWYGSSPDPAGLSLCVGDAAGCGPDPAGMAERFDKATATLLDRGQGPREVARRLDFEARRIGETFATVLCCGVDRSTRSVTLLQVGHPPVLALSRTGSGRYLDGGRYPPLGVGDHAGLEPVTWVLPADATLLLFTFGLVERPAVPLDVGLDRLQAIAGRLRHLPLADLVDGVVRGLGADPTGAETDTETDADAGTGGDFFLIGLRTSEPDDPAHRGSTPAARHLEPLHRRSV
jgi:Stage II sporulation protein E (SpoIIE)